MLSERSAVEGNLPSDEMAQLEQEIAKSDFSGPSAADRIQFICDLGLNPVNIDASGCSEVFAYRVVDEARKQQHTIALKDLFHQMLQDRERNSQLDVAATLPGAAQNFSQAAQQLVAAFQALPESEQEAVRALLLRQSD